MNHEEFEQIFERWKEENGWYFTWGDLLLILGFAAVLWIAVQLG